MGIQARRSRLRPDIARRGEDRQPLGCEGCQALPPTLRQRFPAPHGVGRWRGWPFLQRLDIIGIDDQGRQGAPQRREHCRKALDRRELLRLKRLHPGFPVLHVVGVPMSNDMRCQRINGIPGVLLQAGTGQNELMSWLARRQYLTEELAGQGRFAQATETLQYEQSLTAAQPSAHLVLQRSVTDKAKLQHRQATHLDGAAGESCRKAHATRRPCQRQRQVRAAVIERQLHPTQRVDEALAINH